MRALSIQQPWAWLIANGYKDIENRNWRTTFRGRFLVHAGKRFDREGEEWVRITFPGIPLPHRSSLERGGIVGRGRIATVVTGHRSRWFVGPVGFVVDDTEPTDFVPCPGRLGFFTPPATALRALGVDV